jgi:hypothetical protein
MRPLFAIVWLTWKAAIRYRLFLVVSVLLVGAVVGLPMAIKHDGSARGFTQLLLTYTLSAITALLGFVTLWLACGTLARDVEECQMQMVAVKPIPRWKIWLGKWLGLVLLNAILLILSGGAVYGLLQARARQLPEIQQYILKQEVLVARGSAREPHSAKDLEAEAERALQERLKENPVPAASVPEVRKIIREQIKAAQQIVPPGHLRRWNIDLGLAAAFVRDQPLFIRLKFAASQKTESGTYRGDLEVGPAEGQRYRPETLSVSADTFHEIPVPPGLIDDKGLLTIDFQNWNDMALLFSLEDGMEVLYREGGFGLNYCRGLGIILCWIALLAAIGLMAASFLSFPVATFLTMGILFVAFSTGTLNQVIEEGGISGVNQNTGTVLDPGLVNIVAVKVFGFMLQVINIAKDFSPVEALSSGRSISWLTLAKAALQIVGFMGGAMAALGMVLFTRRELATAGGQS